MGHVEDDGEHQVGVEDAGHVGHHDVDREVNRDGCLSELDDDDEDHGEDDDVVAEEHHQEYHVHFY